MLSSAAPPAAGRPGLVEERRLWRAGHQWVAGLDEVGRGAWAGPVSVGVAVLAPGTRAARMPRWLRDSKQLSEERREAIVDEVAAWCAAWAVGHAWPEECDRYGMTAALRLASLRALAALELEVDALLVDGPFNLVAERPPPAQGQMVLADRTERPRPETPPGVTAPGVVVPLVGADARCAAVAAASVLAKVHRDRLMREEAPHFPPYCFEQNKGYPSPAHQRALRGYGLSAIHRRSWAFVADLPCP